MFAVWCNWRQKQDLVLDLILVISWYCHARFCFLPLGKSLGLRATSNLPPPHNPTLELRFQEMQTRSAASLNRCCHYILYPATVSQNDSCTMQKRSTNECNNSMQQLSFDGAYPHPKMDLFEMWMLPRSGAGGVEMVRAAWLPVKFTTGWRNDDSRVSLLFLNLWKLDRLQVRRGRGKFEGRLRGCIIISGWQGGALHIIGGKLYWRCAAPLFHILLFHFTKSSSRQIISSGQLLGSLLRRKCVP